MAQPFKGFAAGTKLSIGDQDYPFSDVDKLWEAKSVAYLVMRLAIRGKLRG
jgi:hypothetical protein